MAKETPNNLKDELDKLALNIASAVNVESVALMDRVDAFKALSSYHLGLSKLGKKSGEDDNKPKGETFDAFRKSVETSGS